MDPLRRYQARWIVPVSRPPIEGGVIAVRGDEIAALGKRKEITAGCSGEIRDLGEGAILPGLINAHTHMELSALGGRISPGLGFVDWVRRVLVLREKIPPELGTAAAESAWQEMRRTGCGAVGDWINGLPVAPERLSPGWAGQRFFEVIGFTSDGMHLPDFSQSADPGLTLGAHAPHSTSAALLQAAKAWTRERRRLLAIHVAESREEIEFLLTGNGIWKDFLIERGKWPGEWQAPKTTPVKYLESLGLLDEWTLAVHLTQAPEEDLHILRRYGSRVAVCPRSNLFITGSLPLLPFMLAIGLEPALGTDSLASNQDLDLWGEMAAVAGHFPGIDPGEILRMATVNGASALNLTDRLGDLAPGKKAPMFYLPLGSIHKKELSSAIIHSGGRELRWLG